MIVAYVGMPANAVVTGLVIGLAYALLGAGLLLVYRATKVINFAHGQLGALCATVLAKLVLDEGWSFPVALVGSIALGGCIGAVVERTVIRRLFDAPRLQLFVATLGVAQVLLLIQLRLPAVDAVSSFPTPLSWTWTVGDVTLGSASIMVLLIAPPTVLGVGWFLTRTWTGLTIRASADNADLSELSGMSTRRISTVAWVISGALAALTTVVLNPVLGVAVNAPTPAMGPGILLPALAATLVGGLRSLPWTLAGGVGIGVAQSVLVVNFPQTPGLVQALLFAGVLGLVLVRKLPSFEDRPGEWSLAARTRPVPDAARRIWWVRNLGHLVGAGAFAIAAALPLATSSPSRLYLFSHVLIVALAGVSVTVLTGWAGQLSLGQYAFAGLGAVTACALVARGYSFPASVGFAVVAGTGAAVLVGFPALRIRGLFLAVTTLAFAVAAQSWLFRLDLFRTGDDLFFRLPRTELFGLVDLRDQQAYYYLCLAVLTVASLSSSRLRKTGIGRAFVATSTNEDCASSFGLSVTVARLSAFAYSGGLAALAGALYAGLLTLFALDTGNGQLTPFGPEQSIQILAVGVIGGLGSVSGAILGAIYVVGLPALFDHNDLVGLATTSIGFLLLLLYVPGGLASVGYRLRDALVRAATTRQPGAQSDPEIEPEPVAGSLVLAKRAESEGQTVEAAPEPTSALDVRDVSVRFGGRTALAKVSLSVFPGEIVGLIGSNGAGKSTLMNVVSGFQPIEQGSVRLFDTEVTTLAAHDRARLGLGRVFQDARLFGDLTVRETVMLALEGHERSEFVPALLGYPPARHLERRQASEADDLLSFLALGDHANSFISELSTGTRRLVELCCLIGRGSSMLLLDEPTAGVAQREAEAFGPLIRDVAQQLDASVLIIEHDMPLVMSLADRVYCLDAGACIAEGTPDAVRGDPAVVAAYMGTDEKAISRSGPRPTAFQEAT